MASHRTLGVIKQFTTWAAFVVFLLVGASAAFGQETASILGTVKDASGAAVAGANVTARNTDTALSRTAVSDSDGAYRIPSLPVGSYEVRVEHEGFQVSVRAGLVLTVALEAVVNISLQVGSVSQTVEVTAEAPLVNTTTSSLGGLVDSQRMTDLPLNGRNYIDLSLMQVGIAEQKTGTHNVGYVGNYVVSNGATVRSNNYLIDGANMTNAWGVSSASVTGSTLGVDGIREYKVITNSVSAEYGMTAGSQMVMVSKGGTNQFHGDAFEYLRNSAMDARNYFDTAASSGGKRLPEFQRNNFGASVGGAIKKNKIFFDSVYEGLRARTGITSSVKVLPDACLNTNPDWTLVDFAGCNTAAGLTGTTAIPKLTATSAVPMVERPLFALSQQFHPNLQPGNFYSYQFKQPSREDYGQMRVDESLGAKDSMFERWTIEDSDQPIPGSFPGYYTSAVDRTQFITISEDHIFSPTVLNTLRAHFSRTSFYWSGLDPADAEAIHCIPDFPACSLGITGYTSPSSGSRRRHKQNLFSQSDDVFYTRGRNSFKFGGLMNEFLQVITNGGGCCGTQTFDNVGKFFQLLPKSFGTNQGPSFERTYKFNTFGVYAQDDFRVTSRLTLNLGMRYEFSTTPYEAHGEWSVIKDLALDKDYTVSRYTNLNPTLRNFSPRFGFAWDIRGDGKTALRGGIGQLYDIGGIVAFLLQTQNSTPPYSQRLSILCNPTAVLPAVDPCAGFTLPLAFPTSGPNYIASSLAPRPTDWNLRQTRILNYNLTLERQLPFSTALTVAYAGSRGYNISNTQEGNPVTPTGVPGTVPITGGTATECIPRPTGQAINTSSMIDGSATACWLPGDPRQNLNFGTMDLFTNRAHSWYNALQVGVLKRLSHGLQFQSSYTWSKSIDEQAGAAFAENTNSQAADGVDTFNINNERGPTVFDIGQVWKFNVIYMLPSLAHQGGFAEKFVNGWRLGAITTVQTGYPYSLGLNAERSISGVQNGAAGVDRPDILPGRNLYNITHGVSTGCAAAAAGTPLGQAGLTALYYDPCAFAVPTYGFLGNMGRNTLRGPNYRGIDFSVAKDTPLRFLGEGGKLEFRAEIFNILNHPNFALPNRTIFPANKGGTNPTADQKASYVDTLQNGGSSISATLDKSRQVQLALKVIF